ncbi:MAG: 3-hydroxy-3-methylglutaryl-CoA reductase, partial [Myxococcota bacterium]|nr:3-hydroxy-3-methylglutaryl-CoA reductase [Myxococcota bacterium]
MTDHNRTSRIPGFHRLSIDDRLARVAEASGIDPDELARLSEGTPMPRLAAFIENVVARFDLPLGIATNFQVDGKDVLIPMATEETSVVAAASNAARLVRAGGGFHTEILEDLVIGQIEVLRVPDVEIAHAALEAARDE